MKIITWAFCPTSHGHPPNHKCKISLALKKGVFICFIMYGTPCMGASLAPNHCRGKETKQTWWWKWDRPSIVTDIWRWRYCIRYAPINDLSHVAVYLLSSKGCWTPEVLQQRNSGQLVPARNILFPVSICEGAGCSNEWEMPSRTDAGELWVWSGKI